VTFSNCRELVGRHKLPLGYYVVIPSTFRPNESGDFLLRIFSEQNTPSEYVLLTTSEAAWYVILVVSVHVYVCTSVCQTITFESLDAGSSYLHLRYIFTEYGSSSYMKVTGAKKIENSYSRNIELRSAITCVLSNIEHVFAGGPALH